MTDTIRTNSTSAKNYGSREYLFASLLALAFTVFFAYGKDLINLILSSKSTIVFALALAGLILALVFVMHNRAGRLSKKQGQETK